MRFIDEVELSKKTILLRTDYNVSRNPDHSIANDERMRQSLPSITYLLSKNNKLVLISHLGQPKGPDPDFSLDKVATHLQELLPGKTVIFVKDFYHEKERFEKQQPHEILLLENLRFHPGEKTNDPQFVRDLAALADVYVNDAFSVSHRSAASVVGITMALPSYAGLLLKKEVTQLKRVVEQPEKPFIAILGGAKISSKLHLIDKLMHIADHVVVGGGIANTFLKAAGYEIGKSLVEEDEVVTAQKFLSQQEILHTEIVLPRDIITGNKDDSTTAGTIKRLTEVTPEDSILDIGPDTQAHLGSLFTQAKTIVWNGPVGFFENPVYKLGTDFLYYAITENTAAFTVVGGGETLSAIAKKEYLDKIDHISTGGGAMLEYIEKGTLPGIDALSSSPAQ